MFVCVYVCMYVCVCQVLTNFESDASVMFTSTKRWGEFYCNELEQWGKLHTRIQRNIMAEFQQEMGIVKHDKEAWWVNRTLCVCMCVCVSIQVFVSSCKYVGMVCVCACVCKLVHMLLSLLLVYL